MNSQCHALWITVLLATLGASSGRAAEILLNRSDDTAGWWIHPGWEFPGAKAKSAVVDAPDGKKCLELDYDFSHGGRYAAVVCSRDFRNVSSLGLAVRTAEDGSRLFVRVEDSTGQTLLAYVATAPGKWQTIKVPLVAQFFAGHWGGANDGKLHAPIRSFCVGAERGAAASGRLLVGRLTGLVEQPADQQSWRLTIVPGPPDGVAFPDQPAEYRVCVENCRDESCAGRLEVIGLTDEGQQTSTAWDLKLLPQAIEGKPMVLPTSRPGYRSLRAQLQAGGRLVAETESGLAVVPRGANYAKPAPDCYFGFCAADNLELIDRLGAKTALFSAEWRHVEPARGLCAWEGLDGGVAEARKRGIQVLLKLQPRPPDWAAWRVPDRPVLAGYPAPEHMTAWRDFVRAAAERYRGRIVGIEIDNEPDLSEWLHPKLSLDEGSTLYARLLTEGWEGVKAADPNCLVAGLGVTQNEFHGGFKFSRAVLRKSGKRVDLLPMHPYANEHWLGPNKKPESPEQYGLHKLCRSAIDMLGEAGLPRRMWIGEVGWALDTKCPALSEESLRFAGYVAQALVLGRTVPGVERFLYFTQFGCNEGGCEYGVLRGSPRYPLPAVCAYATCARMLDRVGPAVPVDLGPRVAGWRFEDDRRQCTLLVVWCREGRLPLRAKLPPGTEACSSFGRSLLHNDTVQTTLDAMPAYFRSPTSSAIPLEDAIRKAIQAREK
jgi:hypothetical protein